MTQGPLSHLRVLDLSRVMAGPWAGQQLADLGADVIKVERPGVGDDTRSWGPPFLAAKDGSSTDQSGYFLACNRGKRSVTVALDSAEGQAIIRELAARSDVVLENFKVGTLARYGLGPDDLLAVNPRLIYCSITGFGQDGPRAHQVAYDFMIQAMGGLMSVTGEVDGAPGGGPQKVGVPIVDIMTGMYATVAVLAALARRGETGRGEVIDLAMFDVQAGILANQAMNQLLSGVTPRRYGNGHPNIMPQQIFACAGGAQIVLACGNDRQFQALCRVLERADLAADPRYVRNAGRVEHRDALLAELARAFVAWDRTELVEALAGAAVPCGPINDIGEVFRDPQAVHRELLVDVPHPQAGSVRLVNSPLRFRHEPVVLDRAPPALGADTDVVLRQIGLGDEEIARLRDGQVI